MDILIHAPWWIWLLVSIIPYSIKRRKTQKMQSLAFSALLWQFCLTYKKKHCSWDFSLPWIEQIRHDKDLRRMCISKVTKLVLEQMKKAIPLWK